MKLLLCSASPRRREFLERLGVRFQVAPAHIDETQRAGEPALEYAMRLAREKAAAGAGPGFGGLGADTVVVSQDQVLGKPRDTPDAERMLRRLSGAEHEVITAVAIAGLRATAAMTRVRFAELTEAQVRWLGGAGGGDEKGGGHAPPGRGGAFIERLESSLSHVGGLPLPETLALLQ